MTEQMDETVRQTMLIFWESMAESLKAGVSLREALKQAREKVPPKAWRSHDTFFHCQRCGTILWRGTHWKRIAERLAQISAREAPLENDQRPAR